MNAASPFLIVLGRDMSIKLQLERALIFIPVGPMTRALRPKDALAHALQVASTGMSLNHFVTRIVGFFIGPSLFWAEPSQVSNAM